MASNINPAWPVQFRPRTDTVRANFGVAQIEITDLQGDVTDLQNRAANLEARPIGGNLVPGTGIEIHGAGATWDSGLTWDTPGLRWDQTGGDAAQTIALSDSGVTPGSYTNADITVDATGRVLAAQSGTPGTGTNGGGIVNAVNVTAPLQGGGSAATVGITLDVPGLRNMLDIPVVPFIPSFPLSAANGGTGQTSLPLSVLNGGTGQTSLQALADQLSPLLDIPASGDPIVIVTTSEQQAGVTVGDPTGALSNTQMTQDSFNFAYGISIRSRGNLTTQGWHISAGFVGGGIAENIVTITYNGQVMFRLDSATGNLQIRGVVQSNQNSGNNPAF